MAARSIEFEHAFKSPLPAVWRAIADTNRFNKALGFPPVVYRDEPMQDGTSRRFCRQGKYGFDVEYEELPFTWIHERMFRVERLYAKGPIKRLFHTCKASALDEKDPSRGSLVQVIWEWDPRGPIDAFVASASIKQLALKPFRRVFRELDERLQKDAAQSALASRGMPLAFSGNRGASADETAKIDALLPQVKEILNRPDAPIAARLAETVKTAGPDELRRMQPLVYARAWSSDVKDTLDTFLAATRAGLLRMRWDVICPHCRGDKKNLASLCEATERAFCSACNIDFDVDLDRSLEAVFAPHPQVRSIEEARYCLGGPGSTPHMFFQQLLAPGEETSVAMRLPRGRYRLRVSGEKTYRWLDVGSGSRIGPSGSKGAFEIQDGGIEGADLSFPSGGEVELAFKNGASRRALVAVESVQWATDALSAGEMISDQRFRDLFSGEVLAPGVKLAVERATILFTDLVGSTAMYEQLGDAPAFRLVWTHFDVLREIISTHRGAIVKTIGDAIMAVFMRPEDALSAAGELHARIGAECKERGHAHPVTLKIGMHDGPCIAVTLNDRLDYFGSTVNLAARVEAQSKGGDIVVSRVLADATQDAEKLRAAGWRAEPIAAHCKGFKEPIPMLRFTREEAREAIETRPLVRS